MTNKILVDTSGFFSLYDEADEFHKKAVSFYDGAAKRLTTNYVLAEYSPLALIRGVPRGEILRFSRRILDDKDVEVIWVDEFLHRQAVELLQERADKTLFALRCGQFCRDATAWNIRIVDDRQAFSSGRICEAFRDINFTYQTIGCNQQLVISIKIC